MDVCRQVAEYKIETGKNVFDKVREEEKLAKVRSLTHNDFNSKGKMCIRDRYNMDTGRVQSEKEEMIAVLQCPVPGRQYGTDDVAGLI